jgi:hypothetical protein
MNNKRKRKKIKIKIKIVLQQMAFHIENKIKSLPHIPYTSQIQHNLEPGCAKQKFKTSEGECRRMSSNYNQERKDFMDKLENSQTITKD